MLLSIGTVALVVPIEPVRIEFNRDICPEITGRKWTEWDDRQAKQDPNALNGQKFSPFTRQGSQVQSLSRPPFSPRLQMYILP